MQREILRNRQKLDNYHLNKLRFLLTDLEANNAYYKSRLQQAGVSSSISNLQDFTSRMPLTTREELLKDQIDNPPYGTNFTYPQEYYTRFHQTSTNSGVPLRWLDTVQDWQWIIDNWLLIYDVAEVRSSDRIFFPFSFGPFLGFWGAFEAGCKLGCLCIPGGGLRSPARLRMIIDNEVSVLCCTPTYALRLGIVAAEQGISLTTAKVRTIVVSGEPGGSVPATRKRIQEMWNGCKLFDQHGMTEVGPVSFQCPNSPGILHIIETSYFPEILDPKTGTPVEPGECGELVLTTLGRNGSPLLRYRTNDWVRLGKPGECGCGKAAMTLVGGILGRVDDMIPVRGINVCPSAVENIVRQVSEIRDYRVEIRTDRGLREMAIEIEVKKDAGDVEVIAKKLETLINNSLSLRVPVTVVPKGTIPSSEITLSHWVVA